MGILYDLFQELKLGQKKNFKF